MMRGYSLFRRGHSLTLRIAGLLLYSLCVARVDAGPVEFQARVISITDGDTLTVLFQKTPVRIRLSGVDAPEVRQAYGSRARQFAASLAFGKTVTVRVLNSDRYGRKLGTIILPDGRNLNHELVRAGFAWWFRRYAPRDRELERLEARARGERAGLWRDTNPTPPWAFRDATRRARR